MKKALLLLLLISMQLVVYAQTPLPPDSATLALYREMRESLKMGLDYMEQTQRTESIAGHTWRGEWPVKMGLRTGFLLLGNKRFVDDSNCFSVTSTHNSLANIYLLYPEYDNIPNMLDLSFEKILSYKNGNKFNFWNLYEPLRDLKKGDIIGQQPQVRRPPNYKLGCKYINKAANIVDDADDTGLAYSAIALRKKIKERSGQIDSFTISVKSIAPIFDNYRDMDRKNRHWYNWLNGNDHNTGAYLTWLGDEYRLKHWNPFTVLAHNAIFYLPSSECHPHPYVPYIPYGTNDLDGVVNANVLSTLSLYGELDSSAAVPSALKFLEKKSERQRYDRVGIYYPNRFQFPYAVTQSYANGVKQLDKSTAYIVEYILRKQHKNGSWTSRRIVNKKDRLQSTAFALNALLFAGDIEQKKTVPAIEKAITFLLQNSISDSLGVHWTGGVFFSGGTVVRNTLFWKSDAYTTSIVLTALARYRNYLEQKYANLKKENL